MKTKFLFALPAAALVFAFPLRAEEPSPGAAALVEGLQRVLTFVMPDPGAPQRALELEAAFENATGSVKFLNGRPLRMKLQPPDRFFLATDVNGPVSLSSDGTKVWIHVPKKNMLLEGD